MPGHTGSWKNPGGAPVDRRIWSWQAKLIEFGGAQPTLLFSGKHMRHSPVTPVAPPVVPPPLPQEVLPPPAVPVDLEPTPSFYRGVIRDLKIGGVCLLVGWLAGQIVFFDRPATPSWTPVASSITPQRNDHSETESPALEAEALEAEALEPIQSVVEIETPDLSTSHPDMQAVGLEQPVETGAAGEAMLVVEIGDASTGDQQASPAENRGGEDSVAQNLSVDDRQLENSLVAKPAAADRQDSLAEVEPPSALIEQASQSSSVESLVALTSKPSIMHPQCVDGTCQQGMESHGTLLKWADTPADAYRMANEQHKLVFMIHVSGNFEIPGFT